MKLMPREKDKLLVAMAAIVATAVPGLRRRLLLKTSRTARKACMAELV